jgi:hypothetical protein
MHLAWLYVLHAQYRREGVDYHYRLPNGWFERIDGEKKTWDLARSVRHRWPNKGAVRTNLELTIALRNKIEHRYHEAIALATSGYAQALLLNFEDELTTAFGPDASLGQQLRFPIFVAQFTPLGDKRIQELRDSLPKTTRDFLARFESDLDASITNDQRYEFRINMIPKLGPKAQADQALTFVREDDLTAEERETLQSLGRTGSVVVREQIRPVSGAGMMRPKQVIESIQARTLFVFNQYHFVQSWRRLGCRPPSEDAHPERTDERYCVYHEPHRDYLYTKAFVEKVVRETRTAARFEAFTGQPAIALP